MLISVIIPVYNAATYLEACIASLRALPLPMEIILVDDGSTDGSDLLCDRLGDKALHQTNHGVSSARNAGINLASGDWIWFVDADDYIESIQDDHITMPEGDFVNLGFVWEENDVQEHFIPSAGDIPYNLWRCWFRRYLIDENNLRFTEGRKYAEDQEFILKYLLPLGTHVRVALPEIVYHYTMRQGSAMTKKGIKRIMIRDIWGVFFSIWCLALFRLYFPRWIWYQSYRLIKTSLVAVTRK